MRATESGVMHICMRYWIVAPLLVRVRKGEGLLGAPKPGLALTPPGGLPLAVWV